MEHVFLKIEAKDNVAVALRALSKGTSVSSGSERVTLVDDIPAYHKFAVHAIAKGAGVVKYGERIGDATADIAPGEHVHVHNVMSRRG